MASCWRRKVSSFQLLYFQTHLYVNFIPFKFYSYLSNLWNIYIGPIGPHFFQYCSNVMCTLPNITPCWFYWFIYLFILNFFLMILDEYLVGTCWVLKKKNWGKKMGHYRKWNALRNIWWKAFRFFEMPCCHILLYNIASKYTFKKKLAGLYDRLW